MPKMEGFPSAGAEEEPVENVENKEEDNTESTKNSEGHEKTAEQIEKEIAILQERLTEVQELEESALAEQNTEVSPEDWRNKSERIQDVYQSTKIKVDAAVAMLGVGVLGTLIHAGNIGAQNPELAEKFTEGSGWMAWGAVAVFALGHAYAEIKKKLQERSSYGESKEGAV